MKYSEQICVPKNQLVHINKLLKMGGQEIYDKLGLKRDETITYTVKFPNGYEADIKVVICEDDTPYIDTVLFNERGCEITCSSDDSEQYDGEYCFEEGDKEYVVTVLQGGSS
jgi:hypothetical protein